jgi:hypothetical protein
MIAAIFGCMNFIHIASLTLAAGVFVVTANACTVQVVEPSIPVGMTAACANGEVLYSAGIKPASNASFIGLRSESTTPKNDGSATTLRSATFSADVSGTICGDATIPAACTTNLEALSVLGTDCQGQKIVSKSLQPLGGSRDAAGPPGVAAPQQAGTCNAMYLAYTRGDEVAAVNSIPAAIAFFGAIDTPQEAMYLAKIGGEPITCGGTAPAAFRQVAGGYEVQSSNLDRCGRTISRRIVFVSTNGTIIVRSSASVNSPC